MIEASMKSEDSFLRVKLSKDLLEQIHFQAKRNARTVSQEVMARLGMTIRKNEEFMSHDRLMRLIFSKKLAYKSKTPKSLNKITTKPVK